MHVPSFLAQDAFSNIYYFKIKEGQKKKLKQQKNLKKSTHTQLKNMKAKEKKQRGRNELTKKKSTHII
jgi:hypothetical protein